jgi:hypothetical protein
MPTADIPQRSIRRADLCSSEHAQRVAFRLFDTEREDMSIVKTDNPLQPLRVMRTAKVVDRSAEIVVVTG